MGSIYFFTWLGWLFLESSQAYYNLFSFMRPTVSGIALVQDSVNGLYEGSTDPTLSFSTRPNQHGFVWLSVATWSGTVTSVTDNQTGNTYVQAFAAQASICGARVYGYFAPNVNSAGTFTVTIHGTGVYSAHLREYAGVAPTNPLDQSSFDDGISATPTSSAITTTDGGELYLAAQTHCASLTTTPGSGWGNHAITTEDSSNYQALSTEDKLGPPGGVHTGTFTFSASDAWVAGVASFRKQ